MSRSILVVAPGLPLPADYGGAIRTFNLIRELAREHHVILVAPATKGENRVLHQLGDICDVTSVPSRLSPRTSSTRAKRTAQARSVISRTSYLEWATWNAQLQAVIDRLFLTRRIDLVQYEFTQMAIFRPTQPRPTIINAHNIEHELLFRVAGERSGSLAAHLKRAEARKVRRLERRLWSSATVCVVTAQRDAEKVAGYSDEDPIVVPNGVGSAEYARRHGITSRPNHIVFTGVLRHQPNVDGVIWYLEHVHPLVLQEVPDASVSIVGADPPRSVARFASDTVRITGRVEDVRPYLHDASVAVVPLFSGGGTRIKILEAFAAGVPVVSTPIGAEGLDVSDGLNIFLAADPRGFARSVIRLLTNETLARHMADAGAHLSATRYDWSIVAGQLHEAHERAMQRFSESEP